MASGCPEYSLVPYLRGEIGAHERERVERHLAQCARCRDEIESFRTVLGELGHAIPAAPPVDWAAYRAELNRKLDARLARGTARGWVNRLWARPGMAGAGLAVAGVCAVALAVFVVSRSMPPAGDADVERLVMQQVVTGPELELLQNYGVVEHLDMLENYDVIEHLDELSPPSGMSNET